MIHLIPEYQAGNAHACVFWKTMKPNIINTTLAGKTGETIQGLLVGLSSKPNTILLSYKQTFKELAMAFLRNWKDQYLFLNI